MWDAVCLKAQWTLHSLAITVSTWMLTAKWSNKEVQRSSRIVDTKIPPQNSFLLLMIYYFYFSRLHSGWLSFYSQPTVPTRGIQGEGFIQTGWWDPGYQLACLSFKAYAAFVCLQQCLPSKANGLDMLLHDTCSKGMIFMDVVIPWGFSTELSIYVWMQLCYLIKAPVPPSNSIQEVIYIESVLFTLWSFIYHV